MPETRRRGRRIDPAKLRALLLARYGSGKFSDFAQMFVQACPSKGPSYNTVLAFCRGEKKDKYTWEPITRFLGIEIEEIEHVETPEQTIARVKEYSDAIRYVWCKPEKSIRAAHGMLDEMRIELVRLSTVAPFLGREQLGREQLAAVGMFAGDLANCLWSISGKSPTSLQTIDCALVTAGVCAAMIEGKDEDVAAVIQGKRYYNMPNTFAWASPDSVLSDEEVNDILKNVTRAHEYTRQVRSFSPELYGWRGFDSVLQRLSQSLIHIKGGKKHFRKAEEVIDEAVERSQDHHLFIRAEAEVFRSVLASRQDTPRGLHDAIEHLYLALEHYQDLVQTSRHYLIACCRMRLRELGESLKHCLDEDLDLLQNTKIRHSEIVNLDKIRRDYSGAFSKRGLASM